MISEYIFFFFSGLIEILNAFYCVLRLIIYIILSVYARSQIGSFHCNMILTGTALSVMIRNYVPTACNDHTLSLCAKKLNAVFIMCLFQDVFVSTNVNV